MEWTGARYADLPTVEVATTIDAPPEAVWAIVSNVTLMPTMSQELQNAEWLDGATGPAVGNRFRGSSRHEALGEWSTVSHVVECTPQRVLAWAVEDVERPSALWRFTLEPEGERTRLRQWVRLGPGRSGLSLAIDRMPEKEAQIVFVRMREFEKSITATLQAIKEKAEQQAVEP